MNVAIDTSGRVQMENGPVDGQAGKNRRDTNHAKATTDTRDWADDLEALGDKVKSYVKDTALFVGRNSFFHLEDLTDEELDDVGGVEFGAIRVLSWLVPLVSSYAPIQLHQSSRCGSTSLAPSWLPSSSGLHIFQTCIDTIPSLRRNLDLFPFPGAHALAIKYF